jgi:hypothetical protein
MKRLPYITQKHTMPRTSASWCKASSIFAHFICGNSLNFHWNLKEGLHI